MVRYKTRAEVLSGAPKICRPRGASLLRPGEVGALPMLQGGPDAQECPSTACLTPDIVEAVDCAIGATPPTADGMAERVFMLGPTAAQ